MIIDLINKNSVNLNLVSKDKASVVDELVDLVNNSGSLNNKNVYRESVFNREELSTTAIEGGVAIPHAKSKSVNNVCLAVGISKEGIDYEAFDESLSHLFFMIATPDKDNDTHLEVLSRLSTILMDKSFRNYLINVSSVDEFLNLINEKEKEKFQDEKSEAVLESIKNDLPLVLAVTSCPTGIVHTFMAAENLYKKASSKGVIIKVETNGSTGIKNALTKEEIENANCIIVADDNNTEMNRFNGKKIIITKIYDVINKTDELIDRAVKGDAPTYYMSGENN